MPWNPETYAQFAAERAAPFLDLAALIAVRPRMRVVDLGCGTGELTARLADMLPESDVLGIDSAAEMLAKAAPLTRPGLRFERSDIAEVSSAWDLVFSHAALQWLDGHDALIPRVFALVAPGGQLAVQVPSNHGHITHAALVELASEEPFRSALSGWARVSPVLGIGAYARILFDAGGEDIVAFEKVYPHVLRDADAVVDWMSGTALVPYMERLPEGLRTHFVAAYRERIEAALPGSPVFYPFRRTLFVVTRGR